MTKSFVALGFLSMANQTMLDFGQMTLPNVYFYITTLLFAALSFFRLYLSFKSFGKPVNVAARIYGLIVSLACVGITIFWSYWGITGLKLWAY